MRLLAIETSCDETSAAIVEDGYRLITQMTHTQIDLHSAYGGVIPEIAARSHIEVIHPVIDQCLHEAAMTWDDIDGIAVTQGPGLLGSLLIGVTTARTLAWAHHKPLFAVHHILGHVYANWITEGPTLSSPFPVRPPEFPVLALVVSGGHTQLMLGTSHTDWRVIGRTQDDAVGEAFDKVAKVLGLPYPGGPSVSACAQNGDAHRYNLPRPRMPEPYDFSFSGLKTAVLRAVQSECGVGHDYASYKLSELLSDAQRADFAASFEHTALSYLVDRTHAAFIEYSPKTVIIGGGVAASRPLRKLLSERIDSELLYAPIELCTDNAAMIGARAYIEATTTGPSDHMTLAARPSWPL